MKADVLLCALFYLVFVALEGLLYMLRASERLVRMQMALTGLAPPLAQILFVFKVICEAFHPLPAMLSTLQTSENPSTE